MIIAALVVIAVLSLLLYQFRRQRAALEQQVRRLERQNDIGRVLLTDRNVRGLTRHVAESAARLMGSDLAHITLATDNDQRLVVEAATGALAASVGTAVPLQGSMAGRVMSHAQPIVLNDPAREPGWRSLHDRIELRRSVMVPLVARGRCVGALGVDNPRDGRPFGAADVAMLRDLAEYAALAIEAIQAIEELERANRMKAQFLANMSHELRTPLNSVIGFSEILLMAPPGRMTEADHDALQTISRNGRHLLGLVNDILDLAKVDAGRMDLHLAPVDVRTLVPGVVAGIETLLRDKRHAIDVRLADEPLVVRADAARARQVLVNLLSNAIKFTAPGGRIGVRASTVPGAVRIAVSDTGIGIAAEDLPKLFSEFSQIDASYARRYDGTGLGLSLCRRFMDMHGGRIGVESTLGKGSTFWVEFPVEGPPTP
jgi:signal transduction histidine kinase